MAFKIPSGAVRRMDLPGLVVEDGDNFNKFAAFKILPPFEVLANQGSITRLLAKNFVKNPETDRPRRAAYKEINNEAGVTTWSVKEHGLKTFVDDEDGEELGDMNAAIDGGGLAVGRGLARRYEYEVASLIWGTGGETTWTASGSTGLTVSNAWNTSSGTPISDVNVGKDKFALKCPFPPNTLIIHEARVRNLFMCTQWQNQFKGFSADMIGDPSEAMLKSAFKVDNIIIVGAKQDTANETAAMSLGEIWSQSYAALAYISTARPDQSPQLGRSLIKVPQRTPTGRKLTGPEAMAGALQMWTKENENPPGENIYGRWKRSAKILDTSCYFLFKSV